MSQPSSGGKQSMPDDPAIMSVVSKREQGGAPGEGGSSGDAHPGGSCNCLHANRLLLTPLLVHSAQGAPTNAPLYGSSYGAPSPRGPPPYGGVSE
jgi:hypothetical protein